MNLKKIVGPLVVVFVLFWIISRPHSASGSVNHVITNLHTAGSSIVTFMSGTL